MNRFTRHEKRKKRLVWADEVVQWRRRIKPHSDCQLTDAEECSSPFFFGGSESILESWPWKWVSLACGSLRNSTFQHLPVVIRQQHLEGFVGNHHDGRDMTGQKWCTNQPTKNGNSDVSNGNNLGKQFRWIDCPTSHWTWRWCYRRHPIWRLKVINTSTHNCLRCVLIFILSIHWLE